MGQPIGSAKAVFAALHSRAVSREAWDFVGGLVNGLEVHERMTGGRTNQRRQSTRAKLTHAVEAFVADLMVAAGESEAEGWVYRPMRTESFSDVPFFSIKTFRPLVKMMLALGFVEAHAENDTTGPTKAIAAHWRATGRLLGLAAGKGIAPENVHQHFIQALPERPLVLREPSKRETRHKVQGKRMSFKRTPRAMALEADIKRLNAFLDHFDISDGKHRGYTRIFNNGVSGDYGWDQGGRLYSLCHGSYQNMKSELRPLMRIGGEAVAEIDVRSSYLTVLHGITGKPFDVSRDAYDLEGLMPMPRGKDLTRWVVKQWAVVTLGQGSHMRRWPDEIIQEFRDKTGGLELGRAYPIWNIRQAMELKHPVLKEWGSLGLSWGELMFRESEAMLGAMLELMDGHGIPSLTVHDSLIVRESDVDKAQEALKRSYKKVCGIKPFLVVKQKGLREVVAPHVELEFS